MLPVHRTSGIEPPVRVPHVPQVSQVSQVPQVPLATEAPQVPLATEATGERYHLVAWLSAHRGSQSHFCDWCVVGAFVRWFVIGYSLC